MGVKRFLLTTAIVSSLGACASNPNEPPLYGNYDNVDNQSLCLGIMAFVADYPSVIWPKKSKGFYTEIKETYGLKSAALYKLTLEKYGKQDAAERGMTGYSSAKSLAYVLGPNAVIEAVKRCEPVADEALKISATYQDFLKKLESEKPNRPSNPDLLKSNTQPQHKVETPIINELKVEKNAEKDSNVNEQSLKIENENVTSDKNAVNSETAKTEVVKNKISEKIEID